MLISNTKILSGILVNFDIIKEIPVTPPSKIVLGIKKILKHKLLLSFQLLALQTQLLFLNIYF